MHRRIAAPLSTLAIATLALAAGPLLAGQQGPANVKGKLTGWENLVPVVYADAAKPEAHRYTWRDPSPTVKKDFRTLSANVARDVCVVAIASAPQGAHDSFVVSLTGGRITPSTVVVAPGTRVQFKNNDPFPHSLFDTKDDKWAASTTAPLSTRDWASSTAGLHEIHDELFPTVRMFIVIDPNAAEFARPANDGSFGLALVPGEYSLKVFFEGRQVGKTLENVKASDKAPLELKEPMAVGGESK
jgi:plastocyanin